MNCMSKKKNSGEIQFIPLSFKNSDKSPSFHTSDEEHKEKLIENLKLIKETFEVTEPLEIPKITEYLNACLLLVELKKVEVKTFETDFFKKQMQNLK